MQINYLFLRLSHADVSQIRMSDVYPTGEARLIQDSAIRMRWREGSLTPVMMEQGEVYEVTGSLWNTSYVLAPSHKLRLVVTSSNSPRFSVNPNNGHLLADEDAGEFITANNVLYHSDKYPSHFTLPVVSMSQLPELHDIKGQFNRAFPDLDADELLRGKIRTNRVCYLVCLAMALFACAYIIVHACMHVFVYFNLYALQSILIFSRLLPREHLARSSKRPQRHHGCR